MAKSQQNKMSRVEILANEFVCEWQLRDLLGLSQTTNRNGNSFAEPIIDHKVFEQCKYCCRNYFFNFFTKKNTIMKLATARSLAAIWRGSIILFFLF